MADQFSREMLRQPPRNPYDDEIEGTPVTVIIPKPDRAGPHYTPEQEAALKAEIIRQRMARVPFRRIAESFSVDVASVYRWYSEAMRDVPDALVSLHRQEQLDMMDRLTAKALEVLDGVHFAHSNGKVVIWYDHQTDQDTPLLDSAPALAAIKAIVEIEQRKAKLLGLDQPIKVANTHELTPGDIELATLVQQQHERNAAERAELAAAQDGATE
jgi:hypothetical protein